MRLLDAKFRDNKLRYIAQSVMGGLAVAAALLFFNVVSQPMIIASFGASGFIAFTMPYKRISRPRCLIGGYIIGIIVGCLLHPITDIPMSHEFGLKMMHVMAGAAAVGLAMFLMSITNTEHAPATSIALGLVLNEWTFHTVVLILAGINVILVIQRAMKPWMIDLI
ncbi:MAG: HPP family protein [Candidatus Omnitrophota bacterium]